MNPTAKIGPNASVVYKQLAEERLSPFITRPTTIDNSIDMMKLAPKRSLEEMQEIFKTKIREIQKKANAFLRRPQEELSKEYSELFTSLFSERELEEFYINYSIRILLENFAITNGGTLKAQGLNAQAQASLCQKITDFVVCLIQKEFNKPLPLPLIRNKVYSSLTNLYDREIKKLSTALLTTKPSEQTPEETKNLLIDTIKNQFPDHQGSYEIANYRFVTRPLNRINPSTETILKKWVKKHLDPYILKKPLPNRSEPSSTSFLGNCRAQWGRSEPFPDQLLLEIYISYLIDEMHQIYAFENFRTFNSHPLAPEKREEHCRELLRAIDDSIDRDFKEMRESLPSLEAVKEQIQASLIKIDLHEISFLMELFVNAEMYKLGQKLVQTPDSLETKSQYTASFDHIYNQLKERFPIEPHLGISQQLSDSLHFRIKTLHLAVEAWTLFKEKIEQLFTACGVECLSQAEALAQLSKQANLPSVHLSESLIESFCPDLWESCSMDEREEILSFLTEQLTIFFTPLQKSPLIPLNQQEFQFPPEEDMSLISAAPLKSPSIPHLNLSNFPKIQAILDEEFS